MSKQPGISLIEIVIAIALIAIMAITIIPKFTRRGDEQTRILSDINLILRVAYINALITGKVHRLLFNLKSSTMFLQKEHDKNFVSVYISYMPSKTTWNSAYKIVQFLVKGKDEIITGAGAATSEVWFFIMPDGLAQEVTITFSNEDTGESFSLELNPFSVQMRPV